MPVNEKDQNTANHLANERTFLAWIRTSVGLMAFGFVVVKFSLFVKQFLSSWVKEMSYKTAVIQRLLE